VLYPSRARNSIGMTYATLCGVTLYRMDRERICAECVRGLRFPAYLTPEERTLANDPHQREQALWVRLSATPG
jgi:hypothetical protein